MFLTSSLKVDHFSKMFKKKKTSLRHVATPEQRMPFDPRGMEYNEFLDILSLHEYCLRNISPDQSDYFLDILGPILETWKAEKNRPIYFGTSTTRSEIVKIVRSYVENASRFLDLQMLYRKSTKEGACVCGKQYTQEGEYLVCESCKSYHRSFVNIASYSKKSPMNVANQNNYDNSESFIPALEKYQGRENVVFPDILLERFYEYCGENGIDIAKIGPNQCRDIFKVLGYSEYYGNVLKFLHQINDYPLPDISEYENVILQDYYTFRSKYEELKDEGSSSLNSQYVLQILLNRRKIPYRQEDLKVPRTLDIRRKNDSIASAVFRALSWTFTSTI